MRIDLKDCTLLIRDGTTPTANELEIKIGEGNITYSEKRNMEYIRDRGVIDTVREGDEEPMDVSFDFNWDWLKSASGDSNPTIEEALKQTGLASSWVTSAADPCEPYAVDIIIQNHPDCSDLDNEDITLPDFRWESLDHDPKAGNVSVTGKCNAKVASLARVAQTT